MHRFSATLFVSPQQLGQPRYFAPGLAVIASMAGREIRLQVVAHGPIAAAANAVIAAEAARDSPRTLDKRG